MLVLGVSLLAFQNRNRRRMLLRVTETDKHNPPPAFLQKFLTVTMQDDIRLA